MSQTFCITIKDHFNWVVRRGASLSPATGPIFDHTAKAPEGQYLALIGRNKKFLSRAEIRSPSIDLRQWFRDL